MRLARLPAIAVMCLAGWGSAAVTPASLVEQVSETSYRHYMEDLLYTHFGDNRGPSGMAHELAGTNIRNHFARLGLDTSVEEFTRKDGGPGRNIVGVKKGTVRPGEVYILGAHYDSVSNPGADDNASGVAAVMEAARILAGHAMEATLVFIAFDAEETGQEGAHAYVQRHWGEPVTAMLNLDMIGHREPGENSVYVLSNERTAMLEAVAEAVRAYGRGVEPVVSVHSELGDHRAFEPITDACALWRTSDNPHYHKQSDSVDTADNVDYDYAVSITRAAVGYLASRADVSWDARSDLDLDGVVTAADLQILVAAWGSTAGDRHYNSTCDLNGDLRVDTYDLMTLVQHFGSVRP